MKIYYIIGQISCLEHHVYLIDLVNSSVVAFVGLSFRYKKCHFIKSICFEITICSCRLSNFREIVPKIPSSFVFSSPPTSRKYSKIGTRCFIKICHTFLRCPENS
ncbi:hypothetical protein WA026_016509 [Henosepilachna vigintioctopunctata]|uniref:Uncharacterized protein n=1 Tax=Henosepilachna vigintioctopunctata TaxID=420089 RepID=A0AAW1VES9_9CUCU